MRFGIPLFKKIETKEENTITKIRFAIIKLAMAKTFPRNTLNLGAGLVRVNLMVWSANSPANMSIEIKAANRGKSV